MKSHIYCEGDVKKEATGYKVKRNWANSFAQNCFELEDGTKIYIDYGNNHVLIERIINEDC